MMVTQRQFEKASLSTRNSQREVIYGFTKICFGVKIINTNTNAISDSSVLLHSEINMTDHVFRMTPSKLKPPQFNFLESVLSRGN